MKISNINIQFLSSINNPYKKLLSLIFLVCLTGFTAKAQDSVLLEGRVKASRPDVEKIHVINLNLEKGAVTNAEGLFQINANENDSLYISSVQFQNATIIVTKEMMETGKIEIELQDKMNELAEVIIDDIKLSGHLSNDLKKISIAKVEKKYELQNNLNEFLRKDREMNAYEKPVANGGIRIDKIAGSVIEKLSANKEKPKTYTKRELANKSIAIVGHGFFKDDLKLNENEICNFVYYCTEDVHFKRLVINNNAFVLIEYFESRINDFKEDRGSSLNINSQIPG